MNIQNNMIVPESFDEIVSYFKTKLKDKYGSDFYIKESGILDTLIKLAADIEIKLQDNILSFSNYYNPSNTENLWQDAMFERIGIKRNSRGYTTFTAKVLSDSICSVNKGELLIRSENSGAEFLNINSFVTDESGRTIVDFCAVLSGCIEVNENDEFKIVSAPIGIKSIQGNVSNISIGSERESDSDFLQRYRNTKSLNARATYSANIANLSKYVDNELYLQIYDKNTDYDMPEGVVRIIAKPNVSDNLFAQAIADTFGTGVSFAGNTVIPLTDISGKSFSVKYTKANDIDICLKMRIKVSDGVSSDIVFDEMKNSLCTFIKDNYGLGSTIYATELVVPVLNVEGVESVFDLLIKRKSADTYVDSLNLSEYEIPILNVLNIDIEEVV